MATPTGPNIPPALSKLAGATASGQVGQPTPKLPDLTELTYDDAVKRYGGQQGPTLKLPSRKEWDALAGSQQVVEHRQGRTQQAARLSAGLGAAEPVRGLSGPLAGTQDTRTVEERIARFQSDLSSLGQWDLNLPEGQKQAAIDFKNLTQIAMGLMSVPATNEEGKQSNLMAAHVIADHFDQLKPHLKELDPDGKWWHDHYQKINQSLADDQPGFKERFLKNLMNWTPSGYILAALGQTGQGAANAIAGIRGAIDPNDPISVGEGLKYAGSSFARGIGGLGEYATGGALGIVKGAGHALADAATGQGMAALGDIKNGLRIGTGGVDENLSVGLDTEHRLIRGGATLYTTDANGGGLNLREALGKDPNSGGLALGLIDTVGLGAVDPLTWVSLGSNTATKGALRTLESSTDDVARMAGRRLANGLAWDALTDGERNAATSSFLRAQEEAMSNMSRAQLLRQGYKNPEAFMAKLRGQASDLESWTKQVRDIRVRRLEDAVKAGSVPGLRVGGTTVIPMRRLYNALGVIDSTAAKEGSWAQQLLHTAGLSNTDELLHFVQNFDGVNVPEHLKDEIRGWDVVANKMTHDDPGTWLEPLLQKAEDPRAVMDQVDAFGRQLFDDRIVNNWQEWYANEFRPDVITPIEREAKLAEHSAAVADAVKAGEKVPSLPYSFDEELSPEAKRILDVPEDTPLRRRIATLAEEDLPYESRFKLDRNWDVFNKPYEWVQKDFNVGGLRGLANREDIIGRLVRRFSTAYSPRSSVKRAVHLGTGVAEMLDDETVKAAALKSMFEDHARRLGLDVKGRSRLAKDAAKEMKAVGEQTDPWEQATRFLTENEDNLQAIIDQTRANGMPALAELTEVLHDIRKDMFDMSVVAGADEGALLARKGYMPRVLTQEVRDAAEKALRGHQTTLIEKFKEMGVIDDANQVVGGGHPLAQGGHLEGRAMFKDVEDLFQVNRQAREELVASGLVDPKGELKLYEDNPMRAVLLRSRQANEAYIYASLMDNLSEIKDLRGRALSYVARTEDEVKTLRLRMAADSKDFGKGDYVVRHLPGGGRIYIDRTIAKEVESMRRIMGAPNIEGTFRKTMEVWNGIWGAYATVPLVGFGFHVRNATGNIYNMLLAGVKDPLVLKDGFVAQRAMSKVEKLMAGEDPERLVLKGARRHSMTFEEALKEVIPEDEGLRNQLRSLRRYDILGSGQTPDLFDGRFDPLRKAKVARGPLDTSNRVVDSGRRFGSMIENHARASLFIDGINKGLTPAAAASRVRQFLFDYSDLTKFEADNVRMLSRFYTFTRKNTALQMRLLLTQPGAIVNANRLMQEVTDGIFGSLAGLGPGQSVKPGQDFGAGRQVPPWADNTLRLYGRGILGGMDTPFAGSMKTTDTLANLLKVPPAFVQSTVGSKDDRAAGANQLRANLRSSLTLLSGGPVEGVRTAAEFTTGVDTFTGAKLDDKDRKGLDTWTRLIDTVFPVAGKINRELEYTGAYDRLGVAKPDAAAGEYSRSQHGLRMLNLMLGLTVLPDIDDPTLRRRNLMGLESALYNELDKARKANDAAGIDTPTMDDLVRLGQTTARNDAMDYLLYHTVSGQPLTAEQRKRIESLVPDAVLKASGYTKKTDAKTEPSTADRANRVREMADAMATLGIELTEDDIQSLILRESGATVGSLKDLGIQPSYQANPYLKAKKPEDAEATSRTEGEQKLSALAAAFGLTVEQFQASRPLLQPAQLKAQQMHQAGYTNQQVIDELVSTMSRQERALLFGSDSLPATKAYEPLTAEEILKTQQKAAAAEAELRAMVMLTAGRAPSQAELDEWMSEVMFTGPEQKAMGYKNYNAPAAEDKTSKDVYAQRLRQKLTATQAASKFSGPKG